jgi:hypothetical protein
MQSYNGVNSTVNFFVAQSYSYMFNTLKKGEGACIFLLLYIYNIIWSYINANVNVNENDINISYTTINKK